MKKKTKIILGSCLGVLAVTLAIFGFIFLSNDGPAQVEKRIAYSKGEKESQVNEYNDMAKWLSYEEYKAINSDVVGMIEFSDRRFPVVQAEDNDEYLHTSIYGKEDIFGVPFVDATIDLNDTENIIIHAHSTYNKDLLFTFFEDYVNDPEKAKGELEYKWTDDSGTYTYMIISATMIDANSEGRDLYWYRDDFSDKQEKTAYVTEMVSKANVTYGNEYNPNEKLITLVTCNMDDNNYRYVLTSTMITSDSVLRN